MNEQKENREYFFNIEILRYLFTIIIVYFHIFHNNITPYIQNCTQKTLYESLAYNCGNAYLIVEFFFIIGGFFLFQTFIYNKLLDWKSFAIKRFLRLWPVYAFSIIVLYVLSLFNLISFSFNTQLINLCFLQHIGLTLKSTGITWFIVPFFWANLFYFAVLKTFERKHANIIIALITYFCFVANINHFDGGFGRENYGIFLSGAMLRALSCMGVGYFIGLIYNDAKEYFKLHFNDKVSYFIFSILEIGLCINLLINLVCHYSDYPNKIYYVIVFLLIFILFLIKKGVVSNICENKYIAKLGKYSYSIYVFQQISFILLSCCLWKSSVINNVPLCIILSLIFTNIIGVGVYYLIENNILKLKQPKTLVAVERERE